MITRNKKQLRIISIAATATLVVVSGIALAQDAVPSALVLGGPNFFASLIAGLILAIAFQMVLTSLSAAAGLNMLSAVTTPSQQRTEHHSSNEHTTVAGTINTISSSFGLWALITASLSLFFASWLAVRLNLAITPMIGVVIGLSVWGLFYVLMTVVEATAVSSLVGSLVQVATKGFRAAYSGVTSAFRESPEDKAVETAARVTAAVRQELFGDTDELRSRIQEYIDQIKPQQMEPDAIADELVKHLSDTEIKSIHAIHGPEMTEETIISFMPRHMAPERARSVAKSIKAAFQRAKPSAETEASKDKVARVAESAMSMAGVSAQDARMYREKVENYLRSTGKKQLNPEGIKHDIEKLISDPSAGIDALKSRISQIDKSTVTALLAERKDLTREEAQRLVDRVDQVLQEIKGKTQAAQGSTRGTVQGAVGAVKAAPEGALKKMRDYLDSLDRPELNYEGIRADFERLMSNPKAGTDALLNRLKSMDRNTLKALIASRRNVSEDDAERMVSRLEALRDEYVARAEQMRDEVNRRIVQVKTEALHQADEARKTAALAAWWVFGSAVVSGIAAVLGGLVGATTGPF